MQQDSRVYMHSRESAKGSHTNAADTIQGNVTKLRNYEITTPAANAVASKKVYPIKVLCRMRDTLEKL